MSGPVDLSPAHLATVERILEEHVPDCEVRAFGSRATWTAKDYSDLDLAVVGDSPLDWRTLSRLKEAFEESTLPMRVDVLDWHGITDAFRDSIERDSVVIRCRRATEAPDSDWQTALWGELATLEYGKSLRGCDRSGGSYKVYGTNGPIGWHTEPLCLYPSVIIGRKGAYRGVHYSPDPFFVIDTAFYLKPLVELDTRWAYYQLLTHDINRLDSGSAIPSTSREDFYSLPVEVPSLEEQCAIARVLGTLDDKIELNRRMSETLEEMARALFRSWFVDFDPVRAKMEGRPSGLPRDLDALFPDSFEPSELGDVPSGWQVKKLGDVFHITMGQSPPGDTYNEVADGIPFYQGRADFGFRFPSRRVYCTAPRRLANAGDTLVSVRAPVGDVNVATESCCIGRGLAAVRHQSGNRSFIFYLMQSLRTTFERFESAGTVFGSLGKKEFHSLPWITPPEPLIAHFEAVCSTLDGRIGINARASTSLATHRDTLLAKLLSGEFPLTRARTEQRSPNE